MLKSASLFSGINHEMYRYVPESVKNHLRNQISQLAPSSKQDLEDMRKYQFKSPVFLDKSWILKALRFLLEEKLSKLEYAALMLFDSCNSHPDLKFLQGAKDISEKNAFTSITKETISEFDSDIIYAFEKLKFPRDKIKDFISTLQFDSESGDMILVVNNQHRTQLISYFEEYLPIGNKNVFYVFGPATIQKFIKQMAQGQNLAARYSPSYFREVGFDLMHGLGRPEDFADVTKRVVTIPHPLINRDIVHGEPSQNNGLGVYLHDVNYHMLSVSCRIPLSHARVYATLAKTLKDQFPKQSEEFLDMNFPFYSPMTPLSLGPVKDCELLQFGLVAVRKPPFVKEGLDDAITQTLSGIPVKLCLAGVVLEGNELKKAQLV